MTEEDKRLQLDSGFDSSIGEVGYLRASIGMVRENRLLRMLFSDELWEPQEDDTGKEFDFKEAAKKLPDALTKYVDDEELPMSESAKQQVEAGEIVKKMLKEQGFDDASVQTSGGERDEKGRVRYAHSVLRFFMLGVKLQDLGKKPRVYISW